MREQSPWPAGTCYSSRGNVLRSIRWGLGIQSPARLSVNGNPPLTHGLAHHVPSYSGWALHPPTRWLVVWTWFRFARSRNAGETVSAGRPPSVQQIILPLHQLVRSVSASTNCFNSLTVASPCVDQHITERWRQQRTLLFSRFVNVLRGYLRDYSLCATDWYSNIYLTELVKTIVNHLVRRLKETKPVQMV